ncbi:MAG TPA: serine protease [Solirubrobacteraceae bacterium]|nr:serine protease [Solirubrobacteraceae bacterium]
MHIDVVTWTRWLALVMAVEHDEEGTVIGIEPLGSAFAIAPRLFVTAAHILTLPSAAYDAVLTVGADSQTTLTQPRVEPWALLCDVTDDFDLARIVPVHSISLNATTDLALFTTKFTGSAKGVHAADETAPLSIVPPVVGAVVTALGHPDSAVTFSTIDGHSNIDFRANTIVSTGTVEEHFHDKRDAFFINFPAMQGDFAAPGGTSGGPVVKEDGHVAGVVCRSIGPDRDDSPWTTTSSLLPQLFAMSIRPNIEGIEPRKWTIKELADKGIVKTDGTHRDVTFELDENGDGRVHWRYDLTTEGEPGPAGPNV